MTKPRGERLSPAITMDLARELGDRIRKSMHAVTALAENDLDRFGIACGGLTIAIGVAAGFFSRSAKRKFDPIDVGLALLTQMRTACEAGQAAEPLFQGVLTKLQQTGQPGVESDVSRGEPAKAEGADDIFSAANIQIGACDNPGCGAVHINLLDESGAVRAHAAIAPVEIEDLIGTLREAASGAGTTSTERPN